MKGWFTHKPKMAYTATGALINIEHFDVTACMNATSNCVYFPTLAKDKYPQCVGENMSMIVTPSSIPKNNVPVKEIRTYEVQDNKYKDLELRRINSLTITDKYNNIYIYDGEKNKYIIDTSKQQQQQPPMFFAKFNSNTNIYELPSRNQNIDINAMNFYCLKTDNVSRASITSNEERTDKHVYNGVDYFCPQQTYGFNGYCFSTAFANIDDINNCILPSMKWTPHKTWTIPSCTNKVVMDTLSRVNSNIENIDRQLSWLGWPEPYRQQYLNVQRVYLDIYNSAPKKNDGTGGVVETPELIKAGQSNIEVYRKIVSNPDFQQAWYPVEQELLVERSNVFNNYPLATIASSNITEKYIHRPSLYIHPSTYELKTNTNNLYCSRNSDILYSNVCIPKMFMSSMTTPLNTASCKFMYNGTCKLTKDLEIPNANLGDANSNANAKSDSLKI